MANHYRVSPKYWIWAREQGLTDAQAELGIYLLTCEHRNLEGLYRLPRPYIAADLDWPARKVDENLAAVVGSGLVQYDDEAGMVLIPKALKHQAPSTGKQIDGAIAQLRRLPRTSLWNAFRIACESHCPKLADAIRVEWPSDPDATLVRSEYRAQALASSSSSSSNPPQPPEQARGEQGHPEIASPGVRKNSRAAGTNPRALAEAEQRVTATATAEAAAALLAEPTGEQRERWEQLHPLLVSAAGEGLTRSYVESLWLAGVEADGTLVLDGPRDAWTFAYGRFGKPLQAWADSIGVKARVSTPAEHAGLEQVAA